MAMKQYRIACHALLLRTAPAAAAAANRMVHTLCLKPRIRYVAALLSPWTLDQYYKIDKVPYKLFCQMYSLCQGFPLALVYKTTPMGGCGENKLSDERQIQ
jgi:hypothetical protein